MAKLRVFGLAALAILALGATVAASSASAAFTLSEEKCGEGKVAICWDSVSEGKNLRELVGEEPFEAKQIGTSKLKTKFGASTVIIECKSAITEGGTIKQPEPLKAATKLGAKAIKFKECTSVEPKNCTVTTEIATVELKGEAVNQANAGEGVLFTPSAGETFVKIKYTGAECLLKGEQAVKGSQICKFPTNEVDLFGQELKCEPAGSKLFFGAEAAKAELTLNLAGTIPVLEKTDAWDVVPG